MVFSVPGCAIAYQFVGKRYVICYALFSGILTVLLPRLVTPLGSCSVAFKD